MENKEIRNLALNDEALENISGGSVADIRYCCPDCNFYYFVPTFQCSKCGRAPLKVVVHTTLDA